MHFVINVFVTAVCFISIILFKEILNKIVKVLLSVIGCGTLSYALAILVKKCGEWFGCWSGDAQYIKSDFLWIFAIVLVVYIIINIIWRNGQINDCRHSRTDDYFGNLHSVCANDWENI